MLKQKTGYLHQPQVEQVLGDDSLHACPSSPQMNTFISQMQEMEQFEDAKEPFSAIGSPEGNSRLSSAFMNDTCPSPLDEDELVEVRQIQTQRQTRNYISSVL